MSDPNAQSSSIRGVQELGTDDPNYNPNAPAILDWGGVGVRPVFKPGKVMNVMKGTFEPTEEQKEQAQAHLRHVEGILEDLAVKTEAKKRMKFCPFCGWKFPEGFEAVFCGDCGEKL